MKLRDSKPPLVSVIIATYNSSRTLRYALSSVLAQELTDFEVWVIGDACTDDSEKIVRRFRDRRLQWHNLTSNSGSQSVPNNEGIRRARGEYVAFLGHDDLWFPWHLSRLVENIRASGAEFAHSLCPMIGPEGVFRCVGLPHEGFDYDRHYIPPSAWLVKCEAARRVGDWPEPFQVDRSVDVEMLRRFAATGVRFSFLPAITLLKFPSGVWKMYSASRPTPQRAYFRSMSSDAHRLAVTTLEACASLKTGLHHDWFTPKPSIALRSLFRSVRMLIRSVSIAIVDVYGRESWPVRPFLRWRQGIRIGRRRKLRGLAEQKRSTPWPSDSSASAKPADAEDR